MWTQILSDVPMVNLGHFLSHLMHGPRPFDTFPQSRQQSAVFGTATQCVGPSYDVLMGHKYAIVLMPNSLGNTAQVGTYDWRAC
jgi:hypothetical protein